MPRDPDTIGRDLRAYRAARRRLAALSDNLGPLVREARDAGMRTQDIADTAGITHQRVYQLLNAATPEERP